MSKLQNMMIIGKDGARSVGDPVPPEVKASVIRSLFPGPRPIVTVDFLVDSHHREPIRTRDGNLVGFWCDCGVISIDHHGPEQESKTIVSSAVYALRFVEEFGPVTLGRGFMPKALGTHKDADTILSLGLVTGEIPPNPRFGQAALNADHRGFADPIADLLQALQRVGDVGDIGYSFKCLHLYLRRGEAALPKQAKEALAARRAQREKIRRFVEEGKFVHMGAGVYYAELPYKIDGELVPGFLGEEATVAVIAYPIDEDKIPAEFRNTGIPVFEIKTRTGLGFPEGASLQDLTLPNWGGRWNAGGTGRHGGTLDPLAFAQDLARQMLAYLPRFKK